MNFAPWKTKAARTSITTDERGTGLVEYALIVGLIAVVATIAVGAAGSSVSDSLNNSATSISAAGGADEEPTYPTKSAGVDGELNATFALIDGKVVMTESSGDGWTMKVTKDNGSRINTRWKNDTTGEVVRVNGWVNKKGDLKTKVRRTK